ncbi:hypothetical protein QF031_002294 [Pseudarthrobacter defluvii]|nr:hypothetical protein [Pseudarthrobacter defluvii]
MKRTKRTVVLRLAPALAAALSGSLAAPVQTAPQSGLNWVHGGMS